MTAAAVSPVTYVGGSLAIIAVLAMLGWGVRRVRAALMPDWSGPPARLAEIVLALSVLLASAQVLGSFGAFRRWPMLALTLAAGAAMGLIGGRLPRNGRAAAWAPIEPQAGIAGEGKRRSPQAEVIAATLALALVTGQWITHVAAVYTRGMVHPDTLWYHSPFAVRFLESGRLTRRSSTGLEGVGSALHWFLPLNSSLTHAIAAMPFRTDFFSPMLNLWWAAVALLSSWCIGRRYGVGALSLLGTTVVLGLPTIVGTQAGSAGSDIECAALLLAAAALLLEGRLAPAPTAIAALAAGLSLSVKLNVLAPIGMITLGVIVVALLARRPGVAALWCGGLAFTGSYWFLRNWVVVDNPFPWFGLHLGPITFPAHFAKATSIADYLGDGSVWHRFFLPGLEQSLGRAWPLTIVLGLLGGAVGIVLGRSRTERVLGIAVLSGMVAYLFTTHSGDLGGGVFVFTLRYLSPMLVVAFALLAVELTRRDTRWRVATGVALVVLIVIDAAASEHERMPAWPTGYLLPGFLAAAVVVGVVALVRGGRLPRWMPALGVALLGAGWIGGWVLQDHYLDHRYVNAGLPLDRLNAAFGNVEHQRVALLGDEEVYPMFGAHLSNWVDKVDASGAGTAQQQCRRWRTALAGGRYSYVVLARGAGFVGRLPDPAWIMSDPSAHQILDDPSGSIFRIDGRLAPNACPP